MKEPDEIYSSVSVEELRRELVTMVESELTPVALRYGFATEPLEDKIKWRPLVLLLGNYSSGKSTLINELLGVNIQQTGQAPTDDSFTVITYKEKSDPWDERDGMVLLNDARYPFSHLKKQGQRFAAHFRLKQLESPILKNLALIDTPGMLDSVTEKDRGYNYQEVIAELASIADLILVLFDPHKAGTVRETYQSLRQTLPRVTFEDRMLFVLNRIDECSNLHDFMRVYGTLCWNLSQMTGRKDIPPIYLTHSETEMRNKPNFLDLLKNQRSELKDAILRAPKYRLDHLATYIETQGEQLTHYLEGIKAYGLRRQLVQVKSIAVGIVVALVIGAVSYWGLGQGVALSADLSMGLGILAALGVLAIWLLFIAPWVLDSFHRNMLRTAKTLTPLTRQNRQETWEQIEGPLASYLEGNKGRVPLRAVKRDFKQVRSIVSAAAKRARERSASLGIPKP